MKRFALAAVFAITLLVAPSAARADVAEWVRGGF